MSGAIACRLVGLGGLKGGFASGPPLEHVLKGQCGVKSTPVEDKIDIDASKVYGVSEVVVVSNGGGEVGDGVVPVELEHGGSSVQGFDVEVD
eukprot:16433994-Heterocapsa_arctica.AAC.1